MGSSASQRAVWSYMAVAPQEAGNADLSLSAIAVGAQVNLLLLLQRLSICPEAVAIPDASSSPRTAPTLQRTLLQLTACLSSNPSSSVSYGIRSRSSRGRARRWGVPWRRHHYRTAGRRCGTVCPLSPCSGSLGRRIPAFQVCSGLWSRLLLIPRCLSPV